MKLQLQTAVGLLAFGQLACGESVKWYSPPVPGALSAIAAIEADGRTRLIAYDLAQDVALVERPDAEQLHAIFPDISLEALGLTPGVLSMPEDGIALDPYPAFRFQDDGWLQTAAPPELTQPILPHPNPCVGFDRRWIQPLDALNDAHHAIRLGEETVLITDFEGGGVFLLEGEQVMKLAVRPERRIAAMTRSPSGEIWMMTFNGRLVQAELLYEDGEPYVDVTQTTTIAPYQARPIAIDASSGPNPEVVMIDKRGRVFHWAPGEWTQVHALGTNVLTGTNVVLDDAGDFWVGAARSPVILRVRDGIATNTAPEGMMDSVPALELLPEFGLTAMTTAGELMVQESGRWETIDGPFSANNKYGLFDYRGGVLYGGAAGFVGQYRIPSEYCPETLVAQGSVKYIMDYQGGLLLVVDGSQGEAPAVELVDLRF